jgi:dTDP-glucose 4,6-dehydratase
LQKAPDIDGRTVLVTGAGGFIGSHVAELFVRSGARTRVLVHYRSDGSRGWLDRSGLAAEMEVVAGDVRDPSFVDRAVRGADVVVHMAALIGIPYSYHAPSSYVATNVLGTLNVLEACRQAGVERIVHTSTSEVYGTAQYAPMDEKHPLQAQSPYAASKIGADKLAESYHRSFGIGVVTLRPFNTYGPRQSSRAVIPAVITQALAGGPVKIGSRFPRRDFTFVEDTAGGFLAAATAAGAEGRVFNLGSGIETSIGEIVELVGAVHGSSLTVEEDDDRVRPPASEVERLLAANSLASDVLAWKPQVSLESGIRQTIEWFKNNMHFYRPESYAV